MVEVKEDTKQSELPWGDDSYVDALRKIRGLDEKAFFETLEHLMSGYFWQFIGDHDESFKSRTFKMAQFTDALYKAMVHESCKSDDYEEV